MLISASTHMYLAYVQPTCLIPYYSNHASYMYVGATSSFTHTSRITLHVMCTRTPSTHTQ